MHEKRAGAVGRARYLRENRTTAEAKIWWWLRGRKLIGWKFRRQYPIGTYILDLPSIRSTETTISEAESEPVLLTSPSPQPSPGGRGRSSSVTWTCIFFVGWTARRLRFVRIF